MGDPIDTGDLLKKLKHLEDKMDLLNKAIFMLIEGGKGLNYNQALLINKLVDLNVIPEDQRQDVPDKPSDPEILAACLDMESEGNG